MDLEIENANFENMAKMYEWRFDALLTVRTTPDLWLIHFVYIFCQIDYPHFG
jgi:hypothetical protein